MAIQVPPGFSVSLPVVITDGPVDATNNAPIDADTLLTNLVSDDQAKVKLVYPDPTAGVANPKRSIRVDMQPGVPTGQGANFHAKYTSPYDGAVRALNELATAVKAPNAGSAAFGTPGQPFPTPAA